MFWRILNNGWEMVWGGREMALEVWNHIGGVKKRWRCEGLLLCELIAGWLAGWLVVSRGPEYGSSFLMFLKFLIYRNIENGDGYRDRDFGHRKAMYCLRSQVGKRDSTTIVDGRHHDP